VTGLSSLKESLFSVIGQSSARKESSSGPSHFTPGMLTVIDCDRLSADGGTDHKVSKITMVQL